MESPTRKSHSDPDSTHLLPAFQDGQHSLPATIIISQASANAVAAFVICADKLSAYLIQSCVIMRVISFMPKIFESGISSICSFLSHIIAFLQLPSFKRNAGIIQASSIVHKASCRVVLGAFLLRQNEDATAWQEELTDALQIGRAKILQAQLQKMSLFQSNE